MMKKSANLSIKFLLVALLALDTECYKLRQASSIPIEHEVGLNGCRRTKAKAQASNTRLKLFKIGDVEDERQVHDDVETAEHKETEDDIDDQSDYDDINPDSEEFQYTDISAAQLSKLLRNGKLEIVSDDLADDADGATLDELLLDGERTSYKRPWRKVERVVRRKVIRPSKRYLRKFMRKVGLKRQFRNAPRSRLEPAGLVALRLLANEEKDSKLLLEANAKRKQKT